MSGNIETMMTLDEYEKVAAKRRDALIEAAEAEYQEAVSHFARAMLYVGSHNGDTKSPPAPPQTPTAQQTRPVERTGNAEQPGNIPWALWYAFRAHQGVCTFDQAKDYVERKFPHLDLRYFASYFNKLLIRDKVVQVDMNGRAAFRMTEKWQQPKPEPQNGSPA